MDEMFDFINNFDSFEETFDDGIASDSFTDNFDVISDDSQNGFFSEENGIFADNNNENSFLGNELENVDSDLSLEVPLESTPWALGASDQLLGGRVKVPQCVWYYLGKLLRSYLDDNLGAQYETDFSDDTGAEDTSIGLIFHPWDFSPYKMYAQMSEQSDYENISFSDIFSDLFPDFMPDPLSSPQDGSTDFDRAVDNFFEMLDPTEHYHCQEAPNSCAVAVQTDILNDFGINVSEAEMRELGEEHGIFSEEGGTSLEDVGKLLELHGIEVERGHHFDIDDLIEAKANGEKVIIGLDAAEIWNDPSIHDHPLETMSGGFLDIASAGHAVEFKGVVGDYDGQYYVVIDDPGHPHGHNVRIPLDDFDDAWDDFGNFAAITRTH